MTDMDRLIEDVARAIQEACQDPKMDRCARCDGRGYHHGFGEHGHDPDWCERCGGNGWIEDESHHVRAAILATLRGIREPSEAQQTAAMVEFLSGAPLQPGTVFRAMIDRLIQEFAPEGKGEG